MNQKIHIGIILDGNRRYAKKYKLSNNDAYKQAVKKVEELAKFFLDKKDVNIVTVYAMSIDNFKKRPNKELKYLFELLFKRFEKTDKELVGKIRIRVLGLPWVIDSINSNTKEQIKKINSTYSNGKNTVNVLFGYGGQEEIIQAAKNFQDNFGIFHIGDAQKNDKKVFEKGLLVKEPVDLLIRTSGEKRLSGFLPYQTAHAQLYFEEKLFPEVTTEDVEKWLDWYYSTERRFGK